MESTSLVVLPSLSAAELVSRIKEAFTCGGVGLVVGTACVLLHIFRVDTLTDITYAWLIMSRYRIYGITLLQAYIYFHNNGQDSVSMKSFVSKPTRVQNTLADSWCTGWVAVVRTRLAFN